jgi:hypothetical protein
MITVHDLEPGQRHVVKGQGTAITPRTLVVTVHWIGPEAVHYLTEGDSTIKETSLERFLSILNQ